MPNVTDISTSKKLLTIMKDVKESFIWCWHDNDGKYVLEYKDVSGYGGEKYEEGCFSWYPAYTTDDLMERLPLYIDFCNKRYYREIAHCNVSYHNRGVGYLRGKYFPYYQIGNIKESKMTLTNALAQLVLFCGESGYLEEGKG